MVVVTIVDSNTRNYTLKVNGFTLIELIVTLMILGIMAATVLPRFFDSNGFEEYAYRTELISTLRAAQTKAMQQTGSAERCRYVRVTSKALRQLPTSSNAANSFCDISANNSTIDDNTNVIVKDHHVVLSISPTSNIPNAFAFDQMGRPEECAANCEIIITGEETLKIIIEPEGYIHAG